MPKMTIEFDGEFMTLRGYYHIAMSDMDNPGKLAWWLNHLGKKRWGTKNILDEIKESVTTWPDFKEYEVETNPRWAV